MYTESIKVQIENEQALELKEYCANRFYKYSNKACKQCKYRSANDVFWGCIFSDSPSTWNINDKVRICSNENKLVYVFRVHNENEFIKLQTLLNRKFAILWTTSFVWDEYSNWSQAMTYNRGEKRDWDIAIRCYFSTKVSRDKFKKKVEKKIGIPLCGNYKCHKYSDCYSSPKAIKNYDPNKYREEFVWRCIRSWDNIETMDECEEYFKDHLDINRKIYLENLFYNKEELNK